MSVLPTVTKRQISRCSASTRESVNYKPEQPQQLRGQRRCISDHTHFYWNRQLEPYAAKEARRLTLRQLVRSPYHKPHSGLSLSAHSPNVKRNFLGLVWPHYDRRPADHSEQRFQLVIFFIFIQQKERELCANGVASSDFTPIARHASITVRRHDQGRCVQSL
jgi:hypothetical protein